MMQKPLNTSVSPGKTSWNRFRKGTW